MYLKFWYHIIFVAFAYTCSIKGCCLLKQIDFKRIKANKQCFHQLAYIIQHIGNCLYNGIVYTTDKQSMESYLVNMQT